MKTTMTMQSKNFEFIRDYRPELADLGGYAEAILHIDPGSALTRLRSLAERITRIIHKEERLPFLPRASFNDLLTAESFQRTVDKNLIRYIDILRREGNKTAHGEEGDIQTAALVLGISHQLVSYVGMKYHHLTSSEITSFKEITDTTQELQTLKKSVKEYKDALESKAGEVDTLIDKLDEANRKAQLTQQNSTEEEQQTAKQESQQTADSLQWNEAKTRKLLIDNMLASAGWDINNSDQVGLEFPVEHQDTKSGTGYADYVLWNENGKPIAVIEAKKTSIESLQVGREQARQYADGLEKMTGHRPIIFYSNGYEVFIWDDCQYNSYREIYGFYSLESLQYLIYQRQFRDKQLEQNNPKLDIAGRPYQIEAIKAVASKFQLQRRKALIVQATGTGKTRVAIATSELLTRTSWAKRILFLCDRKELRRQADTAFKDHLPTEPRCVVGETSRIDPNARIYIATYQGLMGRFQQLDVGFFDLIIADESHRSIYNKYRDIFEYFDALHLGLTATPVKYADRHTYKLFGCESGDPTFEYTLEDAVNNEPPYLVPYKVKDATTEFLREGIHYNDLTEEQQRKLEEDLGEEIAKQTTMQGKDIGKKLYSDAVDNFILENLMENGIKDVTSSLVGKTIIFAQNQKHAEHLEKCFVKLYPQYGTKVCKVIHNKVVRAERLIDELKDPNNEFRIAISVDMLDTGIDVPEVVNLVFAKNVRSKVKFIQMIGRGTRLSPNLFGPGKDKTEFRIYDHYGNFQFFDEAYQEADEKKSKSLLQHLFEVRLQLLDAAIQHNNAQAFDAACEQIKQDINDLPEKSIMVRRNLRTIHQLTQTDALKEMSAQTRHTLAETIAPLMGNRTLQDKDAIAFDRLVAQLETCHTQQASCFDEVKQNILDELNRLAVNIQQVRQKDPVIHKVQTADYWQNIDIPNMEWMRTELRGIMKYRRATSTPGILKNTTGVKDDGEVYAVERVVNLGSEAENQIYRRRVKQILETMREKNPALKKIYNGEPVNLNELKTLTSTILTEHPGVDLNVLGEFYGHTAHELDKTIRKTIGMEQVAVEKHFTEFLHNHPKLTYKQVQFMNMLKNYIAQHGEIEIATLYEAPFTSVSHEGLDGVFTTEDADKLVLLLQPFYATKQEQNI